MVELGQPKFHHAKYLDTIDHRKEPNIIENNGLQGVKRVGDRCIVVFPTNTLH